MKTACTPGALRARPTVSIEMIFACASGERTNAAYSMPGQDDVVGVAAAPGDERRVLLALAARWPTHAVAVRSLLGRAHAAHVLAPARTRRRRRP